MTDTNQLPPLPTPKFTETIRGVPCITVTEHEHLMHAYALQARAQVQPSQATQAEVTDEQIEEATKDISLQSPMARWRIARAALALRPAATFCGYCGGNDEDPVDHCMDCTRPAPGVPDDVARHIVGWWLCNEANPQDGSPWTTEPSQRVLDHMKVVSGEKHTVMRLVAIDAAMLTAAQAQKGQP